MLLSYVRHSEVVSWLVIMSNYLKTCLLFVD